MQKYILDGVDRHLLTCCVRRGSVCVRNQNNASANRRPKSVQTPFLSCNVEMCGNLAHSQPSLHANDLGLHCIIHSHSCDNARTLICWLGGNMSTLKTTGSPGAEQRYYAFPVRVR